MKKLIRRFWTDDEGQDLIEYSLFITLIAIASVLALQALGPAIAAVWPQIQTALAGA